ncbi:nuclease-related domain-containing protein [Micromonospora taraxaci]|uniref:nuclease-related domain-containing protein n=1 Tax=Micromonospora taraxaci TaxID=1316803 RepID=UPI0033C4F5E5
MRPSEVFFGDRIDDHNELRFLQRIRADLGRRGTAARIYANFITQHGQRQVDFLISTARRLVHVELKTANPGLPLIGTANGPWEQQLPDGKRRSLDRNYYRQALSATYAISDDMQDLARDGEVPRPTGKFYTDIHTVLCVLPGIPAESQLQRYSHVDVVSYEQLLDLLDSDGPHPAWNDEHWSAFTRRLQLYPESIDDDEDVDRRVSRAMLQDYRRRFAAARGRELQTYVPVAARHGKTIVPDPAQLLAEAAERAQTVMLIGPSGAGKSYAARRAAAAVAEAGGVPVWVRCGEYQRGRFSHALSRAVAPFTTQACLPLLRSAADLGCPSVVILDGLNECAPADREVLLEQLEALRLRLPVAVVITSTEPVTASDTDALVLDTLPPNTDARRVLMAVYGYHGELSGVEAFLTPMELSMAAECGDSLRAGATSTELFDAYLTRRCPSETIRGSLRRLASQMDAVMRGSLTVAEVRLLLRRTAASPDRAFDMDAVMSSPLLIATQGRVAFRHESLARFLTAEQLVLDAADSGALADALRDVRRTDLQFHAVTLETDPARRHDLLVELGRAELLVAAVRGNFGIGTAQAVIADVRAVLAQAADEVNEARFVDAGGEHEDVFGLCWTADAARGGLEQALLCVAGRCLTDGDFVDDVAVLLDATDRRCAEEMRRLRAEGNRRSISTVVRATYGGFSYSDGRERRQLAASVVLTASEYGWIKRKRPSPVPSSTQRLWDWPGQPQWGRLTAALRLMNPDNPADAAMLPDIFAAAWKANGYHLRLTALDTARRMLDTADEITRERMRLLLDECDKNDIMLNGLLFEALAAYDGLDPLATDSDIRTSIAEILSAPMDPQAWEAAQHMISMLFEDPRLHGPYAEVIFALDVAGALQLHVMAARASTTPMYRDTIMQVIVNHVEQASADARNVLLDAILHIDWANPYKDEAIRAHLIAVYGWAKIADRLPPAPPSDDDLVARAWRILDELLFAAFRGSESSVEEVAPLWSELRGPYAVAAIDAVAHVRSASRYGLIALDPSPYERLLLTWPDEMRQLFEWCVPNYDKSKTPFDRRAAHDARREFVEDLAYVGTKTTAVLLQSYLMDPEVGAVAVGTIRAIARRTEEASMLGRPASPPLDGSALRRSR